MCVLTLTAIIAGTKGNGHLSLFKVYSICYLKFVVHRQIKTLNETLEEVGITKTIVFYLNNSCQISLRIFAIFLLFLS